MSDLFGKDAPPRFTRKQQLECLDREIRYRNRTFERLILQGKMNRAKAKYEVGCMESIRDTIAAIAERESE